MNKAHPSSWTNRKSAVLGRTSGGDWERETQVMSWEELCRSECRGRWVALDACRYDEATGKAVEGAVVDVDDDLVELCNRIRDSRFKNCAIVFVTDEIH